MVKLEELGYLRSRLSYNKRFNCVFSFREVLAREKVFVEESRFTSPNFLALDQSNRSRLNNVLFSKRANLTEATKLRGN